MRILLIEDDMNLCDTLSFQLTREGHEVELCHDGRDGLDLFIQDAYDLILLDRMLPTMNGLLVLKKARNAGVHTPVIMITASLWAASARSDAAAANGRHTRHFLTAIFPTIPACANFSVLREACSSPGAKDGCSKSS